MPTVVYGLREISSAYAKLERDTRLGMRETLRHVAEPVQRDAEGLAQARITRIGPRWFKMRVGVTRTLVYVAPRQRGAHGRDNPRRRQEFGALLMDKAMEPALERNEEQIAKGIDRFLDRVAADFNH